MDHLFQLYVVVNMNLTEMKEKLKIAINVKLMMTLSIANQTVETYPEKCSKTTQKCS